MTHDPGPPANGIVGPPGTGKQRPVAAAVAVAAVALIIWGVLLIGVDGGGTATNDPGAAPAASAEVIWTPHLGGPAFLRSVVEWQGGFMAVGGPMPATTMLYSDDGIRWLPWEFAPVEDPVSLAVRNGELLVAGRDKDPAGGGGRVLSSIDAVSWTPILETSEDPCCALQAVGERALVTGGPDLWLIEGTEPSPLTGAPVEASRLTLLPQGMLAALPDGASLSADGVTWVPAAGIDGRVADVATTGDIALAIGAGDSGAAAWLGDRNGSWRPVPLSGDAGAVLTSVAAAEGHFIITGRQEGSPMGWITAGAGAWHPLPAEVTDSLNVTYSGYTSPAYGGDGRIFIHGTARVPEPESCETCWVMRPVIWSGSALSGELEATARSAAPASPRGR